MQLNPIAEAQFYIGENLLSKDAPQIAMSYILVQDIFDKLHRLQSFICWNNKAPFLSALYHLPCL